MIKPHTVVRQVTIEEAVWELIKKIAWFEHIYGVSSEEMLSSLRRGDRTDTAEIAQWMVWYRTLLQLTS